MARENADHIRQMIAQQAARMMAEEGVHDYAYAKRKGRAPIRYF
jgi:quinol monooxygenase YgiN